MEKRVVRAFLIINVLVAVSNGWHFATYTNYLLANGLTLFHANIVNAVYMTTSFLLDPSTGRLADKYGQRVVYVTGLATWTVATFIYGWGENFAVFALSEFIAAVGHALTSEALESWMRNLVRDEVYASTLGKTSTFATLLTIPTTIAGPWFASRIGLSSPWYLSAIFTFATMIVAIVILSKLPEGNGYDEVESVTTVMSAIRKTGKSRELRFTVIVIGVAYAAFMPFNMFWQPILTELSGEAEWLGLLWIGIAGATALGAWAVGSGWLKINGVRGVTLVLMICAVMILSVVHKNTLFVLTLFLVHEAGRGALRPLLNIYANRYIENHERSVVNSVRSAAGTLGAAVGLLVSGALTIVIPPLAVWSLSGVVLVVLALYSYRRGV